MAVLRSVLDGRDLTFAVRDGRVVREQTSSTWNVLGEATSGQLKRRRGPRALGLAVPR